MKFPVYLCLIVLVSLLGKMMKCIISFVHFRIDFNIIRFNTFHTSYFPCDKIEPSLARAIVSASSLRV